MSTTAVNGPFLLVDGRVTGWRVKVAMRFMERAIGVGRKPSWQQFDVLWLPRCCAVHGLGVGRCIDVMFTDEAGTVLQLLASWRPGRVAWQRRAAHVWEMPAGSAALRGIQIGTRLGVNCAHGSRA